MSNKAIQYLFDKRGITLSSWAKDNDLSPTSVWNAIYNNKVKKVAIALKNDIELYNELSSDVKNNIENMEVLNVKYYRWN